MFGNLMAIYHIMLQFIQNHFRFVMLMFENNPHFHKYSMDFHV